MDEEFEEDYNLLEDGEKRWNASRPKALVLINKIINGKLKGDWKKINKINRMEIKI